MTPPTPGGPGWQPPAPGAERHDDRPAWLRQPQGWTPTPPPEPPRGRRVGPLMAALVLLVVVGVAVSGLVFATRRDPPPASGGAAQPATPATRAPGRPLLLLVAS